MKRVILSESDLHRIVKESVDRVLAEKRLIREFGSDDEREDLTAPKEKRNIKKVIEVYKHPYMFKVEVEFGTFDEMIENQYRYQTWNGGQSFIGGSFNEKMNETSRAPLIEMAVEFDFDSYNRDENGNLQTCVIGNGVTSIGMEAFKDCTSLTSCTIGSGVTSIEGSAFNGCSSLTSINIPNSVTSIGDYAFQYCNITSIDIPNSVTNINFGAFYSCSSLTSITVEATTPPTIDSEVFSDTNDCPIYVPSDSVDAYKAASGWSDYALRIQAIL